MTDANIYATPTARVGKHEWRCCVRSYTFPAYFGLPERTRICTFWEFRRVGDLEWLPDKQWPTYDSDKWDNGMPASLMNIWEQHKRDIYAALGKPMEPDPQAALAL